MNRKFAVWILAIVPLGLTGADWPQFRGPGFSSVAPDDELPIRWSEPENVAWRLELPGRGPSGPIVVGDRVLVTAASGFRQDRLHVLCFSAQTGQRQWERQFWATGRTATHDSVSAAIATPASDGKCVYASFSSNDLFCLDLDGNLRWYRGLGYDYPQVGNDVGMASSPLLVDGVVVYQAESQGDGFALGLDAQTGQTLWKVERPKRATWASPIVLPGRGRRPTAVLLQSTGLVTAHQPRTGQELWRLEAPCGGICSSLYADDLLFMPMNGLTAVRLSDSSPAPEIAWEANRLRPSSPSPLVYQGRIYTVAGAIVKCADVATGELRWQLRLDGTLWATPVIAAGHMYCQNQDGKTFTVKLGDAAGEIVYEGRLGENIHASPAVANNALYVRSDRYLWKLTQR